MNKLILAAIFLISGSAFARDVYVHGYTRSDGTYVHSYHRTSPNNTNMDNYSTKGNVNPYTGKQGTVQPDYGTNSNSRSGNYNYGY